MISFGFLIILLLNLLNYSFAKDSFAKDEVIVKDNSTYLSPPIGIYLFLQSNHYYNHHCHCCYHYTF